MKKILWILGLFIHSLVFGQVQDDFSDGDLSSNPQWLGDTAAFYVSGMGHMQTKMSTKTDTCFLTTASTINLNTTWEFQLKLLFDPSTSNYARVCLLADAASLDKSLNGYFLQIGESGNTDSYDLYRQKGNSLIKIIDGPPMPRLKTDTLFTKIKITRASDGRWSLFAANDTAISYLALGSVADSLNMSNRYFGILVRYTATRSNLFQFDNIKIYPSSIDSMRPKVISCFAKNSHQLIVQFNESMDSTAIQDLSNFELDSQQLASSAHWLNFFSLQIQFDDSIVYGKHFLRLKNLRDLSGNYLINSDSQINFTFQPSVAEKFQDLVFNEIYPDPSPSLGLPNGEFIEIYNTQAYTIQLQNHSISDGSSTYTFKKDSLLPGAYLILCNIADTLAYRAYGKTIGCTIWPTLNNTYDHLTLKNSAGIIIDSLTYRLSWYRDAIKSNGGYSLAKIDPYSNCKTAGNWNASTEMMGGSPGSQNKIAKFQTDTLAIALSSMNVLNKNQLAIRFNNKIAPQTFNAIQFYIADSNQHLFFPVDYQFDWTYLDYLVLTFDEEIDKGLYQFFAKNIVAFDGRDYTIIQSFGKNIPLQTLRLKISEIMADPTPAIGLPELEFVEISNPTAIGVSACQLYFGNHNSKQAFQIDSLAPFGFAILCEKSDTSAFLTYGKTIGITGFPSIGNSIDTLYLFDENLILIDSVSYKINQWESNKREGGYSLERMNDYYHCSNPKLWHSSLAAIGGSPATSNLLELNQLAEFQIKQLELTEQEISITCTEGIDSTAFDWNTIQLIGLSNSLINYQFSNHYQTLRLFYQQAFPIAAKFELQINALQNCIGEKIDSTFSLFISDSVYNNQVIINELLFNTSDSLPEFIELYNRSNQIQNLKNWCIGVRNSKNEISYCKSITANYYLQPAHYVCISSNALLLQNHYSFNSINDFITNPEMPTLTNEQGTIVLLSPNQQLIDEVYYTDQMHLSLITNTKNVSLERRSENWGSKDLANWGSAAANYGYATPGYMNSNHQYFLDKEYGLNLNPKIFSPNADGLNDILTIHYAFPYPNMMANIDIYNRDGQLMTQIGNTISLGQKGNFIWEGICNGQYVPNGIYILRFSLFDEKGLINNYKIPFGVHY
jgi:gliding motility-associated-like protein